MGQGRVDELFRDETYGEDDEGGEVGLSLLPVIISVRHTARIDLLGCPPKSNAWITSLCAVKSSQQALNQ
jgi:hypothetical protein